MGQKKGEKVVSKQIVYDYDGTKCVKVQVLVFKDSFCCVSGIHRHLYFLGYVEMRWPVHPHI